ncbi:BNR repeat protein [Kribbella amoyensis]|uniref:exo-alpha-sialidase n=1 Tax=Kribbella amoyensis TaxID=996641 RepID=A0A561C105_9ACTN|nr:sialidase family protein [Kribbella amoyensis]TWD84869.1 BNR repeat protein [Kribbella amoyensis]
MAAVGITGSGVAFPQRAFALDADGMESKMLFGDAGAGAAAIPKPSGNGNYHSCRGGAILAIPGTSVVVAVAGGRPNGVADASGNFNLLMRRSTDSGLTWSTATGLAGATLYSWGNETLVHDRTTGRLYCFMLRRQPGELHDKDPKVYIATSDDNGATWTDPVVRNDLNRRSDDGTPTNDFIGPGNGIQRADGTLVIPARGRLIIKEPGGDWVGERLPNGLANLPYGEGTVAERSDGQLILNYRALNHEIKEGDYPHTRRVAIGNPGNWQQFGEEYWRAQIIDPGCHGAQISHTVNGAHFLIHLNSASQTLDNRYAMTLRASADNGETWATYRKPLSVDPLAHEGNQAGNLREGGYSALTSTGSGIILALVEARRVLTDNPTQDELNYESPCAVVLRRFVPSWIIPA